MSIQTPIISWSCFEKISNNRLKWVNFTSPFGAGIVGDGMALQVELRQFNIFGYFNRIIAMLPNIDNLVQCVSVWNRGKIQRTPKGTTQILSYIEGETVLCINNKFCYLYIYLSWSWFLMQMIHTKIMEFSLKQMYWICTIRWTPYPTLQWFADLLYLSYKFCTVFSNFDADMMWRNPNS